MKENNNQDGERSFVSTIYYAVAIGQAERAAKVMTQVETGVFMIMSSYFLSSEFEDRNALNIITGMLSGEGKEVLYQDLRDNGVEATRGQVDDAIVNVLSFMLESGMATLSIALQDSGNKFTFPPGKQSFNIEDLGIKNPFKKNDAS